MPLKTKTSPCVAPRTLPAVVVTCISPVLRADGSQIPDARRVPADDELALVPRHSVEHLVDESPGVRPTRNGVRVVRRPHDVLDAEPLVRVPDRVGLVDERQVDVLAEVLARKP